MSLSPRRAHAAAWAGGIVLVAAAWGVMAITPGDEFADQPFVVDAQIGEHAQARQMQITMLEVQKATHVENEHGWYADGAWVLVAFEGEARGTEDGSSLSRLRLRIGDREYLPSERVGSRAHPDGQLRVGLPETMTAAFEIDPDDAEKRAVLDLGHLKDDRLDSAIRLDIDLAALDAVDSAKVPDRRWSE